MCIERKLISIIFFIFLMNYSPLTWADPETAQTIGVVANHMLEPAILVFSMMQMICLIVGFSFLTASVVKYYEHRINPLGVTLGNVIFLFIFGMSMLILFYFTHKSNFEGLNM